MSTTIMGDATMADPDVYLEKLSVFSRMLRLQGLAVSPKETEDASRLLIALGLDNREQAKTALRTVYAKSREEQLTFDRVFDGFFISEEKMRQQAQQQMQREQELQQHRQEAEEDLQLNGQPMDLDRSQMDTYAAMPEEAREKLRRFLDRYRSSAERNPELCLNTFVMQTSYLRRLIEEAQGYNINSLTSLLLKNFRNENYRTFRYTGFLASVSSFLDYYRYSITLAKSGEARADLLGKPDAPIYTRVHNSSPVIYRSTASVQDSMIADDCIIEGTVINSVLFRGVHVEKGAVVKNSVIMQDNIIGQNTSLNSVITDKNVVIADRTTLGGCADLPYYIPKGTRL